MNHKNWSKLRPLSKLDQLAETLIRQEFTGAPDRFSDNFHIIQSYVDHKGADFRAAKLKRVGDSSAKASVSKGTYFKPAEPIYTEVSIDRHEREPACRQRQV
ncbi:MAG: hypothetical protein WBA74_16100 [Cyclobacteriaceae bacterium]